MDDSTGEKENDENEEENGPELSDSDIENMKKFLDNLVQEIPNKEGFIEEIRFAGDLFHGLKHQVLASNIQIDNLPPFVSHLQICWDHFASFTSRVLHDLTEKNKYIILGTEFPLFYNKISVDVLLENENNLMIVEWKWSCENYSREIKKIKRDLYFLRETFPMKSKFTALFCIAFTSHIKLIDISDLSNEDNVEFKKKRENYLSKGLSLDTSIKEKKVKAIKLKDQKTKSKSKPQKAEQDN